MFAFFDFLLEKNLFLRLFNLSVSASFLVLAVIVLRFLLRKAPKWSICLLWGLVGLRLFFPFSIESVFSLIPSAETVSPDIVYQAEPVIDSGIVAVDKIVNPVLVENFAPNPGNSANPMQILLAVLTGVWLFGVVAILIYTCIGYIRLRLRLRTAVKLRDNIFQSENVSSPFIFGEFRPRIFLPFSMDESDMAYVIAHEQAHIKRLDHLIKPIAYGFLAAYWFNPLLWVAYILFCRDMELACDEKVVREMETEQKKAYSMALLRCSMHKHSRLAYPLAFGEIGVKKRVKNVMHYKKPAFWISILAVVAIIVTAVCFLTVPKRSGGPTEKFFYNNYYKAVEICGEDMKFNIKHMPQISMNDIYYIDEEGRIFDHDFDDQDFLMGELKEMRFSKQTIKKLFAETFVFDGDVNVTTEEKLTFDQLFSENINCYRFYSEDENANRWINWIFVQENRTLYWGYGYAEEGVIRVLWQLKSSKPSPNANLIPYANLIPFDLKEYVGCYQAVERCGQVGTMSYRGHPDDVPYYCIATNGFLFEQVRGTSDWNPSGLLRKVELSQANQKLSLLFVEPFVFDDSDGEGNSKIGKHILENMAHMWSSTFVANDYLTYTYIFIQTQDGEMFFGELQNDTLFFLYRMEKIPEYQTY